MTHVPPCGPRPSLQMLSVGVQDDKAETGPVGGDRQQLH
jgi:hypothetical protein